MKFLLPILALFTLTAGLQAQVVDDGPTYVGTVLTAVDTDGDNVSDKFTVDLDSDGIADHTIITNKEDGTKTVKAGMAVEYKLRKIQSRDKNKPRKLSSWEKIGSSTPPTRLLE